MSVGDPEIEDLAPPAWVRAHETFWACELCNLDRDMSVGEVACGSGQNMLRASSFVGSIVGTESDVDLCARAQRAVSGRPALSVVAHQPPGLPFAPNSIDLLFADLTRPCTLDLAWLDAARGPLRDGGSLLLLTYSENPAAKSVADAWRLRAHDAGFSTYEGLPPSATALEGKLTALGFDTAIETVGEILNLIRATPSLESQQRE